MPRNSMPPGDILDRDIEYRQDSRGVWVRVSLRGHDNKWYGPFISYEAAEKHAERTWKPIPTGNRARPDLEGAKLPAWIR